jgi:hypothetical protein
MVSSTIWLLLRSFGRLRLCLLGAFYLVSGPRSVLGIRHLSGAFVGRPPRLFGDDIPHDTEKIASVEVLKLRSKVAHGRLRVCVGFVRVLDAAAGVFRLITPPCRRKNFMVACFGCRLKLNGGL